MGPQALKAAEKFFTTYCVEKQDIHVVEIGSQDVNGSIKTAITPNITKYVGLDFVEGKGVDVVLTDPYKFPLETGSFDVVVTSSCFEHSEMFWLSFLEGMRLLKDDGLFYCNVPSSWMPYHRFPVDCWRFYPDAPKALETWARYNRMNSMVLESYIVAPREEYWCDSVFVMLKDEKFIDNHKNRMIDTLQDYTDFFNGFRFPKTDRFPDGWQTPKATREQDIHIIGNGTARYR